MVHMKPGRLTPAQGSPGGDLERPSEHTSDSTRLVLIILPEVRTLSIKVNFGE